MRLDTQVQKELDAEQARPRVLCVDDEVSILKSLRRVLYRNGYDVVVAEGGREGLEMIDSGDFDCIICDQRMPDVDGPTVLSACYEKQPMMYRITLTGYTDLNAAQQSINNGRVQMFLTKPWDEEYLLDVVSNGVKQSRLGRENQRLQLLLREQNKKLSDWGRGVQKDFEDASALVVKRNAQATQLLERLDCTLDGVVELLLGCLENLLPNIASHSRRVGLLAKHVATWRGESEQFQRQVYFAGMLHHIGVFSRFEAGVLGDDLGESENAEIGYRLLLGIPGFGGVAKTVRMQNVSHSGLLWPSGEKVEGDFADSLMKRQLDVLHMANAFDEACYADDAVKANMSAGKRLLKEGRGGRFDSALVDLLFERMGGIESAENCVMEVSVFEVRAGLCLESDIVDLNDRLLLKSGTILDRECIQRLRRMCKSGMFSSVIQVSEP